MIKLRIEGTPEEISAFFERIRDADGLQTQYKTTLSKRDASHVWASCKAGINVERRASDAALKIEVSGRSVKKKSAKKAGYVYLIPAYNESGAVGYKIGETDNPRRRRSQFGVKFNFKVIFLAVIYSEDCRKLERELHTLFKACRLGRSEFFSLNEQQLNQIIGRMTQADKELLAELKER